MRVTCTLVVAIERMSPDGGRGHPYRRHNRTMHAVERVFGQWADMHPNRCPGALSDLWELMDRDDQTSLDDWGTPLALRCSSGPAPYATLVLQSAGPDRQWETGDEIELEIPDPRVALFVRPRTEVAP